MLAEPGEGLFACVNGARLQDRLGYDGIIDFFLTRGSKDEFVDIAIGQDAKCSKENHDRNVGLDTRKGGTKHGNELILGMVDDLDGIGFGNLIVVGTNAFDLDDFQLFGGSAAIAEDEGAILGHSLHGNHRTLTSLNNEVASDIFGTLSHVLGVNMELIVKKAVLRSDHNGNLAEMNVGKDANVGFTDAVSGMIDEGGGDLDVDVQRCSVGQIA